MPPCFYLFLLENISKQSKKKCLDKNNVFFYIEKKIIIIIALFIKSI